MKILPPFQLENLLPYNVKYIIPDKSGHQEHRDMLDQGATDPIHTLNPNHILGLRILIPNTGKWRMRKKLEKP